MTQPVRIEMDTAQGRRVLEAPPGSPNVSLSQWLRELSLYQTYRVGIAWQGNPAFPNDRRRSVSMA